jgi:hypothetical protein
MSVEQAKGAHVAFCVWDWLQHQKTIKYVPWVLDPKSDKYDPIKAAMQETKNELLADLERVIREAS